MLAGFRQRPDSFGLIAECLNPAIRSKEEGRGNDAPGIRLETKWFCREHRGLHCCSPLPKCAQGLLPVLPIRFTQDTSAHHMEIIPVPDSLGSSLNQAKLSTLAHFICPKFQQQLKSNFHLGFLECFIWYGKNKSFLSTRASEKGTRFSLQGSGCSVPWLCFCRSTAKSSTSHPNRLNKWQCRWYPDTVCSSQNWVCTV